ncbi:MAG: OsmC family peroxiredoxin [Chloroflexia bacterium]|nr:OsmC family peroxiredoxin [Chloroflexia bacterium]
MADENIRNKAQAESTATAVWRGSLVDGKGEITESGSGAFGHLPVTWAARTTDANPEQTTPEELLAAAHAACYAMAFSHALAGAGSPADQLEVKATVGFDPKAGGGMEVSFSHLDVTGTVPGLDQAKFAELAHKGEAGCPVSNALRGNVQIILHANLA